MSQLSPGTGSIPPAVKPRLSAAVSAARWSMLALVLSALETFAAAPQISVPPQAGEIDYRESAALTVQTAGDGVTLQWYAGASGDMSAPVPGASGALLVSQPLMIATSFWVRASNPDGHADSPAVTVNVRPPVTGVVMGMGDNNFKQIGPTDLRSWVPRFIMSGATAVAAGNYHSLVIKDDLTLWGFGMNNSYQLGSAVPPVANGPQQIASDVVHLDAGGSFSVYIRGDRSFWGVGHNGYGQMGDGGMTTKQQPFQISGAVADAAAGGGHSAFVKTDGTLWTTGANNLGQLGDGSTTDRLSPVQVASGVARIYAGTYHTLFIKTDGSLWGMGSNEHGELGDGSGVDQWLPVKIADGAASAACGSAHSFYLTTGGTLRGMGWKYYGLLGVPATGTDDNFLSPETIAQNVTKVACGDYHSLFITTDYVVHTMGSNAPYGQLGDGTDNARSDPYPAGAAVTAAGGSYHSLFLDASPVVADQPDKTVIVSGQTASLAVVVQGTGPFTYQWYRGLPGDVSNPQPGATGSGFTTPVLTADTSYWVRVWNPYGKVDSVEAKVFATTQPQVTSLPAVPTVPHAGNAMVTAVVSGGQLSYQWYRGESGDISSPVFGATSDMLVSPPMSGSAKFWVRATNLAGSVDSAAVQVNVAAPFRGTLYSCGLNQSGQLGIGSAATRSLSFQQVATDVAAVSANLSSSFFFKSDGSFWGAGENSNSELGDGLSVDRNLPVMLGAGFVAVATGPQKSYYLKADGSLWMSGAVVPGYSGRVATPVKVGDGFASVDSGNGFALALKTDGTLWGEGINSSGQLGQGNRDFYSGFVPIAADVVQAAAGTSHTLFLKRDGSLWGAGSASNGQLGVPGISNASDVPVEIVSSGVTRIAAGGSRSLFLKDDSSCWGMGSGLNPGSQVPAQIATAVAAVDAGGFHAMLLKANHELWVLGSNSQGQLGDGTTVDRPTAILARSGVAAFSGGFQHSLVLDGRPLILAQPQSHPVTTGQGTQLSASVGSSVPVSWQWYRGSSGDISSPVAGASNAIYQIPAVNESVSFWARATNDYGSTDTAAAFIEAVVQPAIQALPAVPVIKYGEHAALPVTASGGALTYSWYEGQPGDTSKPIATIQQPTLVTRPLRAPVSWWVRVSNVAGSVDSAAIPIAVRPREASYLQTTGLNTYGQLGDGTKSQKSVRVQVASRVHRVVGGVFNTYFLKDDGTLWGMGYNHVGQLGRPPTTTETLPVQIASDVVEVAAGNVFILFIKSDGSLWGLGYNTHGLLGTGDYTSRNVPVQIATGVVEAAGGEGHSLFLKSDGSAWAIGRDTDGEIGNGAASTGDRLSPVQIASGVASIAAGEHYTMLVKSDGSLWASGSNSSGQFGDGTLVSQTALIQVGTGVRKVACGEGHTLIHKIDDTLWACGTNNAGQLGIGSITGNKATPVLVAQDIEDVAAGLDYSMFITRGRQLYGMGASASGQLGDGVLSSRSSPVLLGKAHAVACGDNHSAVLDGRPMITTQPASITVESGQSAALEVSAIGPAPISYQWYRGAAGDGSNPVAGAVAASFNTAALSENRSYWVRITNPYGEEASMVANVKVIDLGPAAYRSWAEAKGLSGDLRDTRADPDGDGWSNLMEYALAGDPLTPLDERLTAHVAAGESGPALVLIHRRRIGAAATCTYEWSDDLIGWEAFSPQLSIQAVDAQVERVTALRPVAPGERKGFVRVKVSVE